MVLETAGWPTRSSLAAPQNERVAWLRPAKQMGFSDRRLAALWNTSEQIVRCRPERDVARAAMTPTEQWRAPGPLPILLRPPCTASSRLRQRSELIQSGGKGAGNGSAGAWRREHRR